METFKNVKEFKPQVPSSYPYENQPILLNLNHNIYKTTQMVDEFLDENADYANHNRHPTA